MQSSLFVLLQYLIILGLLRPKSDYKVFDLSSQ